MLLNDIAQIIEFTDSDHLSQAMDIFNQKGAVHSNQLPFLDVIYANASHLVMKKLTSIGFKGIAQCTQTRRGDYIIFDANQLSREDALCLFE
ncbi:hypothetical protein TW81_07265 [Vibrio galatheae]|uniref:Uncharacterized protein n=1 Tax=Vibrio galatheae TaxID=579748 RepID=A0A0F4NK50_9VIBR|nr:hypothetical protein [Vibrio galatheae]KJY83570.1 hypothetical protein TW81_07265 [Vibrio galatheae]